MIYGSFTDAHTKLLSSFRRAPQVHGQRWQGIDVSKRPEAKMVELLHTTVQIALPTDQLDHYRQDIPANYPWADKHFAERVAGVPMNPGTEWANWPWGTSAASHLEDDGKFNHNYMERYWPKHATLVQAPTVDQTGWMDAADQVTGEGVSPPALRGIRYQYGDLGDLVDALALEPDTRQAYLPIFYPEDTGTMNPTRKPCTLGYHFILRHGFFHVTYYMRSCDFYRHWADDCFLTMSLQLWILEQLRERDPETWNDVKLGYYHMHITSLHMFTNDLRELESKL
jgi:hypothetical protein